MLEETSDLKEFRSNLGFTTNVKNTSIYGITPNKIEREMNPNARRTSI